MTIEEINAIIKQKKPAKELVEEIAEQIVSKKLSSELLITEAINCKDVELANCIEAMEKASKDQPELISKQTLITIIACLANKTPRVKWESARVIGNCISKHPDLVEKSIKALLDNTNHSGTVVRWSAAYALGEIILINSKYNSDLIPAIETIIRNEEKASIQKIYQKALKSLEKSKKKK